MRRRLAARDVLRPRQELHLLAGRDVQHVHLRARFAREPHEALGAIAAPRFRRARPDATTGRPATRSGFRSLRRASSSLWKAARRRICFRIASTPSSSATSSRPVEEPMNTLIPAAPGSRSSSGMSATLSCVPPTQKAKSQCMRPVARRTLSASASAVVVGRVGVRHLEHRGHPAEHGRARTRLEILLVDGARLAEMHLAVDHAGQDMQPRAVDALAGRGRAQARRSRRSARRGRRRRASAAPS